jgi:hypothetical protein
MCPFLSSSLFSPCRVDQKTRERHIRRWTSRFRSLIFLSPTWHNNL